MLSLATFDAADPSLNHVVSGKVQIHNHAGLFGAYAAGFLNDVFGIGAYLWPFIFAALGAAYVSPACAMHWWRWCGCFLLTICLLVGGAAWDLAIGDVAGGGMIGQTLHDNAALYLSPGGSTILWIFVLLVGLQLTFNFSWFNLTERMGAEVKQRVSRHDSGDANAQKGGFFLGLKILLAAMPRPSWKKWRDKLGGIKPAQEQMPDMVDTQTPPAQSAAPHAPRKKAETQPDEDDFFLPIDDALPPVHLPESIPEAMPETPRQNVVADPLPSPEAVAQPAVSAEPAMPPAQEAPRRKAPIPLPPLDLLTPAPSNAVRVSKTECESRARALMLCLRNFDIQGELVRITPGPVVTMYEVKPAPGIRVNRIANLSDDLALALKAIAVRIQAPIPGSDTVGIEIPNEQRETVNFRELAASPDFRKGCGPLTMILGKDIAGKPFMADLSRMPHLLVAGATGAGKSVCLNGILVSLLYHTQPEEMRLLLVDPKRIEMAVYADEPHLVHPVVTEMSEAKNALDWAVHEMDRRYTAMAQMGVRNIAGYNQKLASFNGQLPPDYAGLEHMPYLVIVIDELADLMMTAAREVETSIVRLAQLARAAGIHMILATQRPSVDVVTGLIKANFPCRISFQVTSKHDSRTILDQVGAEHLLGRGDMLYKPSGGRLMRLHGPFLSDDEVQNVVGYWKRHRTPTYEVNFAEWGSPDNSAGGSGNGGEAADSLYPEVRAFVTEQGRASISLVQRRFKIGFNRAARLVEQLEQEGIIGPADGSKPRSVK